MAPTDEITSTFEIGMVADPLSWALWPRAKTMLHPALMAGDEDWAEVERDLASNDKQLWAVLTKGGDPHLAAAAVTRIAQTRDGEVAEVYLMGGSGFRSWIGPLSDTIEQSAREIGCIALRAYGRLGLGRILGPSGWRPCFTAVEKAL